MRERIKEWKRGNLALVKYPASPLVPKIVIVHWRLEFNLLSRDRAIVAWHEVPGTPPPQKSRPVGYGLILAGVHSSIR
jgi:hypothetical protein